MATLYHFAHDPKADRIRLACGYKGAALETRAVDWFDDETFFELGIARQSPVLATDDGALHTDTTAALRAIDELFPAGEKLSAGVIAEDAWQALLDWRARVDVVLERLYAPLAPGYHGIGQDADALADFKANVEHRFGMSVEELANDRYDGYQQLARLSRLPELARHLAANGFYLGHPSIADCVIAADLYPLQMHDGINLPVDMMYYLRRVEETFATRLDAQWLAR
ncbi:MULTISPECIES: glutathione S-transferase N-terminal domain-containing protein [unclassified Thioalkalivibrio]|uniref:glutathione S-transferase N-terminal domain-containing protein n=1 Tax=unclassified Thioalkalivibrio TaxID=2621013 RepID=UPI000379F812|nr:MULTISPECIES: glutathione S-transferase family protein [unclassified Thioalkalivibrio]